MTWLPLVLMNPGDARLVDLKDGFVRVESPAYSIEVPKGWSVSDETPWGQRKAKAKGRGELGMMTGGQTQASWQQLYQTSLYFIQREERGTATPFKVEKTSQGYEAAVFSILNRDGFASRRYVLLRDDRGTLLALSVRIPSPAEEKQYQSYFDRMVKSARIAR